MSLEVWESNAMSPGGRLPVFAPEISQRGLSLVRGFKRGKGRSGLFGYLIVVVVL